MASSELTFRGHESQPQSDGSYSSKSPIKKSSSTFAVDRLLFVLLGMAIASLFFFLLLPTTTTTTGPTSDVAIRSSAAAAAVVVPTLYSNQRIRSMGGGGGRVPLGLKRKGRRVVVTGGAGFVGSHLVDRLVERGDSVIVVDNFFTGRKENVMHHFGNPNFEMIRHDVVEPLLIEVDQIYHLACPASPVHYKFNPGSALDECGGDPEHAGAGEACRRPVPPHQHQRGVRRPPPAPPGRDLLGKRQPHRREELLRRGQADSGNFDHGLPQGRPSRGEDC
ncbi:putative UDP-glucuronic acid decarboxylase 2 [Iris pallida]|uniref:UDP-glucuronate decarboxylase n=1 Tax=Iris pallida TaxID=29817 RepID=A0AAX6FL20_IRIPA|nr:putative UDP-glucuronic acid decarboxylase 2 [Iris pallida]